MYRGLWSACVECVICGLGGMCVCELCGGDVVECVYNVCGVYVCVQCVGGVVVSLCRMCGMWSGWNVHGVCVCV